MQLVLLTIVRLIYTGLALARWLYQWIRIFHAYTKTFNGSWCVLHGIKACAALIDNEKMPDNSTINRESLSHHRMLTNTKTGSYARFVIQQVANDCLALLFERMWNQMLMLEIMKEDFQWVFFEDFHFWRSQTLYWFLRDIVYLITPKLLTPY